MKLCLTRLSFFIVSEVELHTEASHSSSNIQKSSDKQTCRATDTRPSDISTQNHTERCYIDTVVSLICVVKKKKKIEEVFTHRHFNML